MRAFVTVGSTRFDPLVQVILEKRTLEALKVRGYMTLVVQCGNSVFAASDGVTADATEAGPWVWHDEGLDISVFRFKPSLEDEFHASDLVISHAGSGTILDVLRLQNADGSTGRPLVVVPNPSLLDNHQEELASALGALGYLIASTVATLPETLLALDKSRLIPFPPFDGSRFRDLLDEEMGF